MIRVLLADDQALVRTGFRLILSGEPGIEVVGEAGDGAEAARLAAELRPDVVLMDVRMPEVDGIEATRRIVVDETSPRVLVLTTFDLDDIVYDALRAGASGFLLKDAPEERLLTAIQVVAEGGSLFAPCADRSATGARRAYCPRARGAAPARAGPLERRDRRAPRRQRAHGEDARRPDPPEARPA